MPGEWFVAKVGGVPVGPLSPVQVKQMADSGQLQGSDLVWKEGLPQWVPASQVKGLLSGSGTALPPAASPPAPSAGPPAATASGVAPAEKVISWPSKENVLAESEPDPWYYGFLETYARVFLWLGISACVLSFLGFVAPVIHHTFTEATSTPAFVLALVWVLAAVLAFGLLILTILFWTALVLLAVDAARNLRSLNRRASRR